METSGWNKGDENEAAVRSELEEVSNAVYRDLKRRAEAAGLYRVDAAKILGILLVKMITAEADGDIPLAMRNANKIAGWLVDAVEKTMNSARNT